MVGGERITKLPGQQRVCWQVYLECVPRRTSQKFSSSSWCRSLPLAVWPRRRSTHPLERRSRCWGPRGLRFPVRSSGRPLARSVAAAPRATRDQPRSSPRTSKHSRWTWSRGGSASPWPWPSAPYLLGWDARLWWSRCLESKCDGEDETPQKNAIM